MLLTASQVRSLHKQLPDPLVVYRTEDAVFEMYRVKDIHDVEWKDPVLHKLLLCARSSYLKYGKRPLLDQYDGKAAIYLVHAIYCGEAGEVINEWLNMRMSPGDGVPLGGGELEIYSYEGESLDLLFQRKFFPVSRESYMDFWRHVVSSSRMCGIHPYYEKPQEGEGGLSQKHRYTALCFALIHIQFAIDYPLEQYPYEYVTAIIRDELWSKGLRIEKNGRVYRPLFTPAYKMLNLVGKHKVKLDREAFAYRFPLYWFNKDKLISFLAKLQSDKVLPEETIKYYLGSSLESEESILRLGELLSTPPGMLFGAKITSDDLRLLVDVELQDVPGLKITEARGWNRAQIQMIEAAGIAIRKSYPRLEEAI